MSRKAWATKKSDFYNFLSYNLPLYLQIAVFVVMGNAVSYIKPKRRVTLNL